MPSKFEFNETSIRVIERGWLNCNQILLLAPNYPNTANAQNILIDSGYSTHADRTLALLHEPQHLGAAPLHRIINTHCHSDHMGGNAKLKSYYARHHTGCRITIPAGEARHLRPWDAQAIWMGYADQYAEPFEFDDVMHAGDTFDGGGHSWQALAAPGHDMDALMFFCEAQGILISGDALWQNGLGFVFPRALADGLNPNIDAALQAIAVIEAAAPRVVIPGHGAPFTGTEITAAIAVARKRLHSFAADPAKNARHVIKVMFVFALLHRQSLSLADLPAYINTVPCYRDLNQFLTSPQNDISTWLVEDLLKAGAINLEAGTIRPTMPA